MLGNEMQIILNIFHSLSYSRQQLLCLQPNRPWVQGQTRSGADSLVQYFSLCFNYFMACSLKGVRCSHTPYFLLFLWLLEHLLLRDNYGYYILWHLCRFSLLCDIFITTVLWQLLWIWGTIHRRTYCLHKETVLWGMTW